jgi:hypothetical protein
MNFPLCRCCTEAANSSFFLGFRPRWHTTNHFEICASAFAKPLFLLFNRSLATSFFPDKWKVSYVTPIFKKGRRNNVANYRGVVILSAIPKYFELLVYRGMYNDLKNLLSINQHASMKNRSTITNLLKCASFVLNSIEDGYQVDSFYADFLKAF